MEFCLNRGLIGMEISWLKIKNLKAIFFYYNFLSGAAILSPDKTPVG